MDSEWLRQALKLAENRLGFTWPNPAVGAVVVRDNRLVGQGFHWAAGEPHAEPAALLNAGEAAKGATLYITLEPCCHHGRTPPCTDAIIAAGIKRVVFATEDPNPAVRGKSQALLEAAGIEVLRLATPAIENHYEPYKFWRRTGRPFVTLKLALSLDGKIAKQEGARTPLSGKQANAFTHAGRLTADALLTSAKTVRVDKPRLDARVGQTQTKKRVYVLDSELSLLNETSLDPTVAESVLLHAEGKSGSSSKRLIAIPRTSRGLDLTSVLSKIGDDGVHHLWVEAGGQVASSLLNERLVNRFVGYLCPVWLGEKGVPAFPLAHQEGNLFEGAQVTWGQLGSDGLLKADWKL